MPTASTHTPADIQRAFERVGRQIARERAVAVTALILEHGFDAALSFGRQLLTGERAQVGLDIREYAQALIEAATPTEALIGYLRHEAELLRRPHPYRDHSAEVAAIEARVGRLVALSQGEAA